MSIAQAIQQMAQLIHCPLTESLHPPLPSSFDQWRSVLGSLGFHLQKITHPELHHLRNPIFPILAFDHQQQPIILHSSLPPSSQTLGEEAWLLYSPMPSFKNLTALLKITLRLCHSHLFFVIKMTLVLGFISLIPSLLVQALIELALPARGHSMIWLMIVIYACSMITATLLQQRLRESLFSLRQKVLFLLESSFFNDLLNTPARIPKSFTAAECAERFSEFHTIVESALDWILDSPLLLLTLLLNTIYLSVLNASLILGLFGLTLAYMILEGLVLYAYQPLRLALLEKKAAFSSYTQEILTGIETIRVNHAEPFFYQRWQKTLFQQKFMELKLGNAALLHTLLNHAYWSLLPIFLYLHTAIEDPHSIGILLTSMAIMGQWSAQLIACFSMLNQWIALKPAFSRLKPLLPNTPVIPIKKYTPILKGQICFKDLHYAYGTNILFKQVSLEIQAGEFVGLMGDSGSGKSTLLRLILGLNTPLQGSIELDHLPLSQLDLGAVRAQIGVVFQQSTLFPGSIYANIAQNSGIKITEVATLAAHIGLLEDLNTMPMGLHTLVNDTMTTLSGGQIQKILLARALAQGPKLLLLDEASSALDPQSEAMIMEYLGQLSITRIMVTHRLAPLSYMDRVYTLKDHKLF